MKCHVCEEKHRVSDCPTFKESGVSQRVQLIKDKRLCFSCLNKGHNSKECRSKQKCEINGCSRTHHRLIHMEPPTTCGAVPTLDRGSIFPVVRVKFRSQNGRVKEGNVLIDSGAGTTLIRKDFSKCLGLQGHKERLDLCVVGGEKFEQFNSRTVKVWISPLNGGEEFALEAHEIDKTILSVPALEREWLKTFSHLSDLHFSHKAGPIDLILGVQYSHLHADTQTRQGLPFEPIAKCTKLGWYVIGPDNSECVSSVYLVNFVDKIDLRKFYDFETLGIQVADCSCEASLVSPVDKKVLDMLESSCVKKGERYEIGLPWKSDPSNLPNNYHIAEKRLCSLERKLLKDPDKGELYSKAIKEYVENDWARIIQPEESNTDSPVYYLPHHGVYRPDKPSTPLRVVFDPACSFMGISLNSLLHKGPNLIGNLFGVLLRFHEDRVAFIGDISKMYLQIHLPEQDQQVHRFLWRDLETSRDPDVYCLQRVTFGDKPSPDMASFVILKKAEESEKESPEAAVILKRDRYMDDLIHSCETTEQAVHRMDSLGNVLATGSFKIKEWICSSENKTSEITCSNFAQTSVGTPVNLVGEDVKTLGIGWNPNSDKIKFMVKDIQMEMYTKRAILSQISMLYDPMGLASVVTIKARAALQDIWRLKQFGWDDPLPDQMCETWEGVFNELVRLRDIEFPRCLKPPEVCGKSELHVFVDASISAYGAVAYLVLPTVSGPEVNLVAPKARVAPIQQTTVPRLELMAALVGSRLAKTITNEFKAKPERITLWSDSQIALHWIRSETVSLNAFVGVRVVEIQSTWDSDHWKYVPTKLNPADDISRGISVREIDRWIAGPSFLKKPRHQWPLEQPHVVDEQLERKKSTQVCAVNATSVTSFLDPSKFSKWQRLLTVTAYCLRFIHNLRARVKREQENKFEGSLDCTEVEDAERYWVKHAQDSMTDWESRYRDLFPYIDEGIIRVGGRLRRSSLEYDQIHPILLPSNHYISKMIMTAVHEKMGHVGAERTLCESRRQFWIVRGRNLAKGIVRSCVICRKLRQPPHTTLMGDLPPERVKPFSPPFTVTGVDLFGPFQLKYGRNKSVKAWGALFTCATSRAVHLEIVQDVSTEAFLQALRRFASHHGWPQTMISDNGTNFVGAQKELRKLYKAGQRQIQDYASRHKVLWIFNTPLSPHQGGMFESLVKQTKRAIQVAIGQQILTWNEMATVFAEVKGLLNSRPLGYIHNDPNQPQPLTPNHFLLGRASVDVPQGPFEETRNTRKRFEHVQMLVQHFWQRFVREYIPTLMRRNKWQTKGRQLQVGDIVLLTDPVLPRGRWSLARIIQVYPGSDGIVRNVLVKTKSGEYRRSIQRCCLLLESI